MTYEYSWRSGRQRIDEIELRYTAAWLEYDYAVDGDATL